MIGDKGKKGGRGREGIKNTLSVISGVVSVSLCVWFDI